MIKEFVLITGSSKGLGESLALVFSQNNYNIILHGKNEQNLEKVRKKVIENNVDCYIVKGDINSEHTLNELVKIAKEKNISILINNAGIDSDKVFEEVSQLEIENVLNTNLTSPIKLINKVYPFFIEKQSGTIININSIDGFRAKPLKAIYCASKYGLKGFTDSLRFEAKKNNIKVIGVYLSGMKTEMSKAAGKDLSKSMEPKEVAQLILNSCKSYPSASIDELIINRTMYD
jgi:short-subunit dehydrogenase